MASPLFLLSCASPEITTYITQKARKYNRIFLNQYRGRGMAFGVHLHWYGTDYGTLPYQQETERHIRPAKGKKATTRPAQGETVAARPAKVEKPAAREQKSKSRQPVDR